MPSNTIFLKLSLESGCCSVKWRTYVYGSDTSADRRRIGLSKQVKERKGRGRLTSMAVLLDIVFIDFLVFCEFLFGDETQTLKGDVEVLVEELHRSVGICQHLEDVVGELGNTSGLYGLHFGSFEDAILPLATRQLKKENRS